MADMTQRIDVAAPTDLVGSAAAARMLGCSQRTVHRLVDSGDLTPILTAPGGPHGAYLFTRSDVEELRSSSWDDDLLDDGAPP